MNEPWTYGDSEVIATGELSDLTNVTERGTHDNGLVAKLLVVVEDVLDALDTRVGLLGVLLLVVGLVPVKDTADEGRDEEGTGLGGGNGLRKGEHKSKVGVDAVLRLQDVGGLDTLVGGGDLDQDAGLVNASLLVKLQSVSGCDSEGGFYEATHVNDAEGLGNGGLGVEGETGVDLGGDLAGNDLENLLTELDEEVVKGAVNLVVDRATGGLAELDSSVDELGVLGLLGSGEDQGGVGGGILRLVLVNGSEVTRVANNDLIVVLAGLSANRDTEHTVPEALSWSRELDMFAKYCGGELCKV